MRTQQRLGAVRVKMVVHSCNYRKTSLREEAPRQRAGASGTRPSGRRHFVIRGANASKCFAITDGLGDLKGVLRSAVCGQVTHRARYGRRRQPWPTCAAAAAAPSCATAPAASRAPCSAPHDTGAAVCRLCYDAAVGPITADSRVHPARGRVRRLENVGQAVNLVSTQVQVRVQLWPGLGLGPLWRQDQSRGYCSHIPAHGLAVSTCRTPRWMPSPCCVAQMLSVRNAGLACNASTTSMASLLYPPPLKNGANHHTAAMAMKLQGD